MKNQNSATKLAELWEKGIERANEEQPPKSPDQKALDARAGLHVQAGVKAGSWSNWSSAYTCGGC